MKKKFICTVCGYVHEGDEAPEKCPICGAPRDKFKELDTTAALQFVTEHELGVAKGCDDEMIKDLTAHFNGECGEVGMYLAMSRQADREGYPEIAEAFKRYAFEEAEHAARFAELLGECVWDTRTNLEKRMAAEAGANEDKMRIARRAKELGLDAIHDTVHEMAKDEARHGQGGHQQEHHHYGKYQRLVLLADLHLVGRDVQDALRRLCRLLVLLIFGIGVVVAHGNFSI
mgnify:CR=1 FL=1